MSSNKDATPRTWWFTPWFLLSLFAVLAIFYSFSYPLFEGADEVAHYWNAKYIADHKSLPDLNNPSQTAVSAERTQMPLYYVIGAILISPIDRADFTDYARFNLNYKYPVLFVHTQDEITWPPYTTILAVRVLRLFSVLLGILTLIFIYRSVNHLGFDKTTAMVVIASMVLNPKYIHLSSSVSNDIAVACASAAVLMILASCVAEHRSRKEISAKRMLIMGVASGIAFLTKLNALSVIVPIFLTMLFFARDKRGLNLAVLLRWLFAFIAGFAITTGPFLVYNTLKYGDPMASAQNFRDLEPYLRKSALAISDIPTVSISLIRTYWDSFGNGLDTPYRFLGYALFGFTIAGFVIHITRKLKPLPTDISLLIPMSLIGANFIFWLYWLFTNSLSAYSRFFAPAFLGLHLLMGLSFAAIISEKHIIRTSAIWITIGVLCAVLIIPVFVLPTYESILYLPPSVERSIPQEGRVTFDNGIQLLSAEPNKIRLDGNEQMRLSVRWRIVRPNIAMNWLVITLFDQRGNQLSRQVLLPFNGHYNTQQWATGVLEDEYQVQMPTALHPTLVNIYLGWYGYDSPNRVARVIPTNAESALAATVKVRGAKTPDMAPSHVLNIDYSGVIALEGYDLQDDHLILYWRSIRAVNNNYSVFVHLNDSKGTLVGQTDGVVQYGTLYWDQGEQVLDQRLLPSINGVCEISVGLYDIGTGTRLTAQSGTSQIDDNAAIIWKCGN
ncbi:MAG: phospholipid carrier-dependent glycosyltransferase [Chloroflexi bacterium]|nr:phospholipid carrier-dependent glycosyltransferase [Chloroflexota bacterium]MCL5274615.1 phospholipid carrier-dependent glycosyltransferase [Chloroflexota bacterium]